MVLHWLHFNERVDDVILKGVHDEGEEHHDEEDLQLLVALSPTEGPVADVRNPWEQDKDYEDDNLHAKEATEIEQGLFEPPSPVGRITVVA